MPVVPSDANLLPDYKELYRFLVACQQVAVDRDCPQIASISREIPPVDPLAVLQAIAQPEDLHFYFENGPQDKAIAAIGSADRFEAPIGDRRFVKAQNFIQSCIDRVMSTGETDLPCAGPYFFCSFTFFDDPPPESAPFPPATVFLPRWQVTRCQNRSVLVANCPLSGNEDLEILSREIWQKINQIGWVNYSWMDEAQKNGKGLKLQQIAVPSHPFKTAVRSALDSIKSQRLNKIVLAQTLQVTSQKQFNIFHSLNHLRQVYPDCYIFSTSNGKGTHFIGASPERLLAIDNQQLVTDALAGSAPRGKTPTEDADLANGLLSSEKEKHEHRVVIEFIRDRLSHLGLSPRVFPEPRLLQLSNIQHLWTPIQCTIPPRIHPLKILAELHPTPAVAGTPRDIATQEIRRYETFDRCLYAAPLGWIDRQGNAEFIVGIRSALIQDNRARLYAGAGIVAGSDPDKELAEIQLKLKTLLKALV
ncbi:isochorismate synthase [Phormidium sp. CCY1219]|uniref:isochorismate synthase n=1 Tax=Phormidium sp. CCY1219 TaxID=2886104 RepID=UPI002D1E93C8|nr:isochorismate synthase [Phormidium sp. CCY1219]MEB3829871.1 isochorismate synthase [Phormidium sp. CCY1219]